MSTGLREPNLHQDERRYPLRKPPGHKPPIPRWMLRFPDHVTHLYTLYVGIQSRSPNASSHEAESQITSILRSSGAIIDPLRVTDGFDLAGTKIHVCYWTTESQLDDTLKKLDLVSLWHTLSSAKEDTGLWIETLRTPISRFEANYAALAHKPGAAQLPGIMQLPHELTAYWGSARDRIPQAESDMFAPPAAAALTAPPDPAPAGIGERIFGTNYDHIAHIRSGQYWETCPADEAAAYETVLQPTLMNGMKYLWEHPIETGTVGLRFVENLDPDSGTPRKETAGVGWFRNWADLEVWSSTHPSHLAIFTGAMKHAKRFGDQRKFMTWHEVSVLKHGEGFFDYVNCDPNTGVMRWVQLKKDPL